MSSPVLLAHGMAVALCSVFYPVLKTALSQEKKRLRKVILALYNSLIGCSKVGENIFTENVVRQWNRL